MENFILDLVEDNNRVIIPNFGAFIISKENGLNILFNNFLSFNDGLLVNYIAEQKGIDTIEATEQVYNYVDNLKDQLDKKGEFKIEKLGVFRKDESGMLRFHQVEGLVLSEEGESKEEKIKAVEPESTKDAPLLDIQKESIDQAKEENTEVEKKIEEEVKEEEIITDPVLTIEKPDPEEKREDTNKKVIAAPIATKTINSSTTPTSQKSKASYSKTVNAVKEKQRKERTILLVVLGIIVVGIGIYFMFFNKPTPVKVLPKPPVEKKIDSTEIKRQNSLRIEQELAAIKADSLRKVEEARMAIFDNYHLIVGSFKVEKNAHNMVSSLQQKGYSNVLLFEIDSKFFVSIDNNKKFSHMERIQQQIMEKEKIPSWIFKKQK